MIVKQINDSFLLETGANSYWAKDYVIDGVRHEKVHGSYVLAECPREIYHVCTKERVVSYGELSPEDYRLAEREILNGKSDEDYLDFETEYKLKKFRAEHQAKFEQVEYSEPVEFEVHNITGNVSNPFIVPYRYLGKEPIKEGKVLYRYTPNPWVMAKQIAEKYGFKEELESKPGTKTFCCPSHSTKDLRFLKISNKYVFYENSISTSSLDGSYGECLERYERDWNRIDKEFSNQNIILNSVGESFDKKMVIEELQSLRRTVNSMITTSKSPVSRMKATCEIDALLVKIGLDNRGGLG